MSDCNKPVTVILGNETNPPVVRLTLVEDSTPYVRVIFQDNTELKITGLTPDEIDQLQSDDELAYDDLKDSARAIEVIFGRPKLILNGQPHPDSRVQSWQVQPGQPHDHLWTNQVSRVVVSTGAGADGLMVALACAGWAFALKWRGNPRGNLSPCHVSDSADLQRLLVTRFRGRNSRAIQKYVRVA